jgi:hypothetical protein
LRARAGGHSYLEGDEDDNPTSQPVSMADLRKAVHEASGPSRHRPEFGIDLTAGRSRGNERSNHRTSVAHDCRGVQALLCQPSASGPHLPERSIDPSDIVACHLLSAQPKRGGEMGWQLHVCKLHSLECHGVIVAFDGTTEAMVAENAENGIRVGRFEIFITLA